MRKYVVAIDPGTTMSGVCLVCTDDLKPLWCDKLDNGEIRLSVVRKLGELGIEWRDVECVIERMQGNNMPVSSDVFLTCEWIGRFDLQMREITGTKTSYVFRRDEYNCLCANIYTHNDKGIRQALVERFAFGQPNFGKGTIKNKGWFYGFAADAWSAYAIAVTFYDLQLTEVF